MRPAIERAEQQGGLFLKEPCNRATRAAAPMIEGLTDAEIAEAHRSADIYAEVSAMTSPLNAFLSLLCAFDWVGLRGHEDEAAYLAYLDGTFGDPIDIAQGIFQQGPILQGLMPALVLALGLRVIRRAARKSPWPHAPPTASA